MTTHFEPPLSYYSDLNKRMNDSYVAGEVLQFRDLETPQIVVKKVETRTYCIWSGIISGVSTFVVLEIIRNLLF
jgi:hypothetical protein